MSIHSANGGENPNEATSHHNNPNPSMEAHSAIVQHQNINPQHQQWVAAYIDGQYYLTDPESMKRLKDIEAEIEQQKSKLAKLENDNEFNHSFLSLQGEKAERESNKSFCNTEFNENKQNNKEEKVKNELEKEEDKYREKIRKMERQRSNVKKLMTPITPDEVKNKPKQSGKEPSERKSARKSSQKDSNLVQVEKSKKSIKSVRDSQKDKSYHKSRIQQSIKDNIELQKNEGELNYPVSAVPMEVQKSVKSSHPSRISGVKKQPSNIQTPQEACIQQPRKSQRKSLRQSEKNEEQVEKAPSNRAPSHRQSSKKDSVSKKPSNNEKYPNLDDKSISKDYDVKIHAEGTLHESQIEPQSDKPNDESNLKSQKEEFKSKKSQSVSGSQINEEAKEEEFKSKKSSKVNEEIQSRKSSNKEEVKSKYSNVILYDEVKSKKSNVKSNIAPSHEEVKSRKTHASRQEESKHVEFQEEEEKSKKSLHPSIQNEEVKSKRSSIHPSVKDEEIKSKRSSLHPSAKQQSVKSKPQSSKREENDAKSKYSSKVEEAIEEGARKSSRARSIKKDKSQLEAVDDGKSKYSEAVSENKSKRSSNRDKFQEKSIKNVEQNERTVEVKDKSCQYSRVTDPFQSSRAQEVPFQNVSEKNNSLIQHHEESMNESSSFKHMINNELKQEHTQQLASINTDSPFKKKKEESVKDNQSEKKSRSFIIHSRNGSVKEKSSRHSDKLNHSKFSQRKSHQKDLDSSIHSGSVTKEQLGKLHEQIAFLREKLRKVEERQEQMQKVESSLLKNRSIEQSQNKQSYKLEEHKQQYRQESRQFEKEELPIEMSSPPQSPLPKLDHHAFGLRPQTNLHLESSIIQVNTREDERKKSEKDREAEEKVRLKDQISRLKKIIRDMQIQKIKSIDPENELGQSGLNKKQSKQFSSRGSRVEKDKQSLSYLDNMPTQQKFWGKSRIDQAGKIIKNFEVEKVQKVEKNNLSPRRRSQQIKFYGHDDQVVMEPQELPYQSSRKKPSKLISEAKRHSLMENISDRDKDFHHFMESSRALVEEGNKRQPTQQPITPPVERSYPQQQPQGLSSFQQFSKISVSNPSPSQTSQVNYPEPANKINYSRLVEEFKKNNPEQDEILPQIHLRDLKIQEIPNTPTSEMNQDDLLSLAKKTYNIFGIDVDQQQKQLCVKKYKNCVVFTLTNNTSQCILWHFSGKFYMGGWKAGQPGQGQKHGEGIQIIPDKYIYKGQFLNGKKNGTGIIKLANGNLYDGQWIQGLKNGRGVYLDAATRVIYSGEWKEGKKDGQGYLKLSDKQYYYGTFNKSVKEGFGAEVFVNGDKYKGEYKNGKFHGKGKYTWANGSCYEGQFIDGVRQGQGSWKSAKNNGDIYIGTYQADKKNGYGRYVWANGCIYQGGFANDVKHGKGRLTYQDGKEVKGTWQQGNLIQTENEKKPIEHEDQPLRRSVKAQSFGYNPSSTVRRF